MNTLKQLENQVQNLLSNQDYKSAYKLCNEVLKIDPDNLTFIKLRKKIEQTVETINLTAIQKEINTALTLAQNNQFDQAFNQLKLLSPYLSQYPNLTPKVEQANFKIIKLLKSFEQKTYAQALRQLDQLIKSNQLNQALQLLNSLKFPNQDPKPINQRKTKIRNLQIQAELKANQALLQTENYEKILLFLYKIKKIDPTNPKLIKLIKHYKNLEIIQKIENSKDQAYKLKEEIKTLFQLKKYDELLEVYTHLQQLNPNDKSSKNYYKISLRNLNNQILTILKSKIINNYTQNYTNYRHSKSDFIII